MASDATEIGRPAARGSLNARSLLDCARGVSIFTHLTKRERWLLYRLACSLQDSPTVVEVGSYLGASTSFLAAGLRATKGKVYAADTWTNLGMSEGPRDTYPDFLRNTARFGTRIVPLRGLSTEVAEQFKDTVDLLFIDGDHSYEGVSGDLKAWLPKVRDRGIVVLHDFNWADGVRRAARELVLPLQVDGGRRLDSIYWARISHQQEERAWSGVRASVIVPTYNRRDSLLRALQSLQAQDIGNERYEILVVDNGTGNETEHLVSELNSVGTRPIRHIRETSIGLHHARHAGAREARGAILVYIDDDVVVPPGWLNAILQPFADPEVAIVGGRVLPKWHGDWPNWWKESYGGYLSLLDLGEKLLQLKPPDGVYGCNMAVRRTVLYEVGGFNPDGMGDRKLIWLRGDGETGLHDKIHAAGYRVLYEPAAWVHHQIPAARLTPEYFYWRAFIQGISDSYSRARAFGAAPRGTIECLIHAAICLLRMARGHIAAVRRPGERVSALASTRYWYGRGKHQLLVAFSPKLRRHVFQESYL